MVKNFYIRELYFNTENTAEVLWCSHTKKWLNFPSAGDDSASFSGTASVLSIQ